MGANNTTAQLEGKTLLTAEDAATITGRHSYSRATSAPFDVNAGAAVVENLDADKVDGVHLSALARLDQANDFAGVQTADTQPNCGAYHSTVQNLSDSTATAIQCDTENFDVGGCHEGVTNPARFTAPSDGLYLLIGNVGFAANATGLRRVYVRKNGTTTVSGGNQVPGVATHPLSLTVHVLIPLSANDYLEVMAYQSSGGGLDTGHASDRFLQNSVQFVKLW